jgi:YARHG domain
MINAVYQLLNRFALFLRSDAVRSGQQVYSHWAHQVHTVCIVGAFVADVLYPLGDGAYYAFLLALVALVLVSGGAWLKKIKPHHAIGGVMFLLVAAALFGVLHVMEKKFGDKHGVVGSLLPPIQRLQERLAIVSDDVKFIRQQVEQQSSSQAQILAKLDQTTDQLRRLSEQAKALQEQFASQQARNLRREEEEKRNAADLVASCRDSWVLRNMLYKVRGYCFKTQRSIEEFGNDGCRYNDESTVPLSAHERQIIRKNVLWERMAGCTLQ